MSTPRLRLQRVLTILACGVAFIAMASVFVPFDSQGVPSFPPDAENDVHPEGEFASVDPHDGLARIGTLEDSCYLVKIYATAREPRYSIYDRIDGRELGVLLSEEQVSEWFPEIPLRDAEFEAPKKYMLVPLHDHRHP